LSLRLGLSSGLFNRSQLDSIHAASLNVLDEVGVAVQDKPTLSLLEDHGARIDPKRNFAFIPENLVSEALANAPRKIALYTRGHREVLPLDGEHVYYSPGSTVPFILDRNGSVRKPVSSDLVNLVRLAGALENIDLQSTALVLSDVRDNIGDAYRLYLVLKNSQKPIMTGGFQLQGLLNMKKLLQIVAGGAEELARWPIAVFCACPTTPLTWGDFGIQTLTQCGSSGIPVEIVPAPQLGITCPATLAGALVQLNTEFLSGLVISQLSVPGAHLIYGGVAATFDMRYANARSAAIESMMLVSGYSQMGKYYGFPTSTYSGHTDAKTIDAQAGLEAGVGIVLATLSGVNIISGPGGMNFLYMQSLEKLVIDDAICGMARRLVRGVTVNEDTIAIDAIKKAGPGGQFLKLKHTVDWALKEQFMPSSVIDRQTLDTWKTKGSKDSSANAAEVVQRLLREHKPEPLPLDTEKRLDAAAQELVRSGRLIT
jgi:trimethylamine--corrinoid protein Co-methyltransferase